MLRPEKIRNFSKVGDSAPIPDLIQLQTQSYKRFLLEEVEPTCRKRQGLEGLLQEVFPIVSYDESMRLEYLYYELSEPRYKPQECRDLRLTYGLPFRIRCRLIRKDVKDVLEESIYVGEIPIMIGGGEFIINGAERVIVSQLHRSPGVDFTVEMQESDRPLHGARIIPDRGSWIELTVTKKDSVTMRIDQSSKIPATMFLRCMDEKYGSTQAILREFYETQKVSTDQLRPQMYLVEAYIDPDSGEELVPAGGQIGDALNQIIATGGRSGGRALKSISEQATDWMKENLEFRWVACPSLEKDQIELLEERLLLEFPSEKNVNELKDLPQFNKQLNKKKDVKKQDVLKKWDEEATEAMREKFSECLHDFKLKGGWSSNPGDAATDKGVYAFRNRKTKDVAGGYIGLAHERSGKGLREGLRMHYEDRSKTKKGEPNDSLQKTIAKFKGFEEISEVKISGRVTDKKIEVISDATDPLVLNTLAEDPSEDHESALLRIYARLRPGNPPQLEKARTLFQEKFYDENRYRLGKVGRFRINRKFKQSVPEDVMTLRVDDFVNTMKYMLFLRGGEGVVDDIDHLGNRRLRTIDELASDEMRKGFLKLRRTVQERMSLKDPNEITKIAELVNSKSISSSIDFFFGRGELSQVVDQQNPLAQLTHERRLSALGPGGLNRKRAGFEVRDVHISHYGRICPIETPEGNNIGLISSMGIYAGVDEYGFLTTPYIKVENRKILEGVVSLRADEEMEAVLAPPEVLKEARTRGDATRLPDGRVLARVNGELSTSLSNDVQYIDISPKQTVGISASLIPFLEHDDANRALMGSNMQRQAVPLLCTEPPIVATGMEHAVVENSGFVVKARKAGVITYADAERIIIDNSDEYELRKFAKLNERACLDQKPIVSEGRRVRKGQIIADGSACREGQLALGRNVLVAFMPFDGYNFEDAILISERLVRQDAFTSVHMEEYEVEIRETKLGREEFTRDIPNVSEKALRYLDENGVVRVGTAVGPGDIMVGKVSPKSKSELSPEEKLLHAIFGRAGEDVKNDSLELPAGEEGVVTDTVRFSRRVHMSDEQKKQLKKDMKTFGEQMDLRTTNVFHRMVDEMNEVLDQAMVDPSTRQKVAQSENLVVVMEQVENFNLKWCKGSPAAREQAKAIHAKYWPRIEEIQRERERKLDQMKRGDELPSGVLEMVKVRVATKRRLGVGDKMAGRHGNKGVIARIMHEEDMPFMDDGTSVDIVLNPLGVPGRMNLGQILETHLGWAAAVLGFQAVTPVFDGATETEIFQCIDEANQHVRRRRQDIEVVQKAGDTGELLAEMPLDGKVRLHDGRTGEPFEQKTTVGYIYMNKLHHLVDEKIHARATGPYSLITQQPLGGKARTGGQRFGEMEVWGLEAYGASYTLQELLTVKSDDVEGRTKIYESMVKGQNTLEAGTPVSFDVLCNELRGLGLNILLEKKKLI